MATTDFRLEAGPLDDGHQDAHRDVSDADLERAALAADPDTPIPDDAEPFTLDDAGPELLPTWYMPVPRGLRRSPARRVGVLGIIVSLVLANGAGLCVTYGWPEIAW